MSDVEDMVAEAKKPGVFSIVNTVKGRGYPKSTVDVYISEDIAHKAAQVEEMLGEIQNQMDSKSTSPNELKSLSKHHEKLIEQKEALLQEISNDKYVFHITGIPEGERDSIEKKAYQKYPAKYDNDRNPFTGESTKKEINDPDRQRFFTVLLWAAHIEKVVNPNGDEQKGITPEEAQELRNHLPVASISKITEAIEKIRAATAVFMMSVNEDFLAKS